MIPGVGGFAGGLVHPLLVPAHLIALLVLGLFIGQQAPRHRVVLRTVLGASLIAGVALVVAAFAVMDADVAVLAIAAAAGLAVSVARPFWLATAWPLPALAGVAIVLDSVPDDISMAATFMALVGSGLVAFLIAAAASLVPPRLRRDWQRIATRIAGSWIAAVALLVLALRLLR